MEPIENKHEKHVCYGTQGKHMEFVCSALEPIEITKSNQPKSKSETLKSINLAEFKMAKIPKPWKLIKKGNRYEFRLGKSADIVIKKMKRVSDEKWNDTSFWIGRWNQLQRNELEGAKDVGYKEILDYELVIAKYQAKFFSF